MIKLHKSQKRAKYKFEIYQALQSQLTLSSFCSSLFDSLSLRSICGISVVGRRPIVSQRSVTSVDLSRTDGFSVIQSFLSDRVPPPIVFLGKISQCLSVCECVCVCERCVCSLQVYKKKSKSVCCGNRNHNNNCVECLLFLCITENVFWKLRGVGAAAPHGKKIK